MAGPVSAFLAVGLRSLGCAGNRESGAEKRAGKTSGAQGTERGRRGRGLKSRDEGSGESDKGPDPERGRSRQENGEKGEKEWKEERMETGAGTLGASRSPGEERGERGDQLQSLRTGGRAP